MVIGAIVGQFAAYPQSDKEEQDRPNFGHGCICHIIALHFGPQHLL